MSLHDGALVVGWLLNDVDQDRAAAEVAREIANNPARIAAVRDLLATPHVADDSKPEFDASGWLRNLTQIGGGYALASGRLWLIVHDCDVTALEGVMQPLIGHPERVEAVRAAVVIEGG